MSADTSPPLDHRRLEYAAPLILLVWVLLNYGWTCGCGFINDDFIWVAEARPMSGRWWLYTALISETFHGAFVRPLVQLSFFVNYLVAGTAAFGYHLTNVLLHLLNAWLVWRLARLVLVERWSSLLAALVFAAQASQADSVTWISGRTELIATAFYLGAAILHIQERPWRAGTLFALALLSKESAASFPIVALLLDRFVAATPRRRWGCCVGYSIVLVAYLLLRRWLTQDFALGVVGGGLLAHWQVTAMAAWLAHQLGEASRYVLAPLPLPGPAAGAAVVLLSAAFLWLAPDRTARRRVWLSVGWSVATLLPYLTWFMFQARYVYLPSVGWALLLASAAAAVQPRAAVSPWWRRTVTAVGAVWLAIAVDGLQRLNIRYCRNGWMTARVIAAIAAAVPAASPVAMHGGISFVA